MQWRTLLGMALMASAAPVLAVGNTLDLRVYDASAGTTLPVYRHDGRYYIAGEPGHEYRLALASRSGGRALAVVSVDGVNAVTGETAAPDQSGYVLGPYQCYSVMGWRKSLDRVASFYFTSLGDSYAARTGRPRNVGVIGVAVYAEKPAPMPEPMPDYQQRGPESNQPAPGAARDDAARPEAGAAPAAPAMPLAKSAASERAQNSLGTGHGRSLDSSVVDTEFERASSTPLETIVIYYDARANLVAQGIIPSLDARRGNWPNPFPNGFVPDP
jgi:hypothetical protein